MKEEQKTIECPLCHKQHECMVMHGMTYVPCPEVPQDMMIPASTLEAFTGGRSMLDEPFIIVQ